MNYSDSCRPHGTFVVGFGRRFFLFCCVTVFCFLTGSLLIGLIISKGTTPAVRVSAVLQDVFLFIVPPVLTACLITRMPARLLMIDRRPEAVQTLVSIAALFAAVPLMNMIIAWNESITFPEAYRDLEMRLRESEEMARATVNSLIGDSPSVGAYIISVLIVGVMAGFSEELFFRGGLQRILITGPVNPHIAIWVTAFIFSAIHMQFYGFIPRLLLGAYFGYLAWWTRTLWIPIVVHVINNTAVVTAQFANEGRTTVFDTIGTSSTDHIWLGVSGVLTATLLILLRKITSSECKVR